MTDIKQTVDQRRIGQLNDLLSEIYFIEQEIKYISTTGKQYLETQCEALRKETVKGIRHIENNPEADSYYRYCFPEKGYMFEKIGNIKEFPDWINRIKMAAERIEELTKGNYPQ